MRNGHRTTARSALALLLLWALTGTASAGVPDRIVFPVVAKVRYSDDFGAPRGQGAHQGNDIMAARRSPVVAVEPGRVKKWTKSWSAGCMLYLYGRSGTVYLYVHLNNDLTRRNDNRGTCRNGVAYAPGLRSGQWVRAGQLVGYVGDSGDADGIQPHLHFELHPGGRDAVSPYRWLRRARHVLFPRPGGNERIWIALAGRLRSTEDALSLRVRRVTLSNGWRARPRPRNVSLAYAEGLVVDRRTRDGVEPASLADAEIGERVVAWTTRFRPTLRAQLAKPGFLTARHVRLRGM